MAESDFIIKKGLYVSGNATIMGELLLQSQSIPQHANDIGQKGQIIYDNDYVYICVADNKWKRAQLNNW